MEQRKVTVTFRTFIKRVEREMKQRYPHCKVEIQVVTKNNGKQLTGIVVQEPDYNIAPNLYLNSCYEDYQSGDSYEDVFEQLVENYEKHKANAQFDTECIQSFANVKDRIYFKLINAEKNKALLQGIPHRKYQDLAIVYSVLLAVEKEESASMNITNQLLESWQVDEHTLYQCAVKNTPRLLKGRIVPLSEVIQEIFEETLDSPAESLGDVCDIRVTDDSEPMYVVSNAQRMHGAAVILYEGVLEAFAQKIGRDFYILPSSIHETLFIPANKGIEQKKLLEMVREVNEKEVSPDEVLSDHVYRYCKDMGYVTLL